MRYIILLLLCPILASTQNTTPLVYKTNLGYTRLEASGDGLFGFEKDDKFGYIDKNEKVIVPAIYSFENTYRSIPSFIRGYARIKHKDKLGLIDKTGKVTVPFEYETLNQPNGLPGYAVVGKYVAGKSTQYGMVDAKNNIIIPIEYQEIYADSNLVAVKKDGKWGLFNQAGKQLLPFEYTMMIGYAKEKVVKAEKDGKIGFIDATGKWLFEKARSVFTLYGAYNGMVLYSVSGKYGFLNFAGDEVIISKFDNASNFEEVGLARVSKKNPASSYGSLYGFIDRKGTEIIPMKYELVGSFTHGLVWAKDPETNRYGYLDKTGKWALKAVYLEAAGFDAHGGAWVKMTDGKYHYINKTGKDLGFVEGSTYRSFNADGFATQEHADYPYVLLDKNGQVVKKLEDTDGLYSFANGIAGYKCKSNSKYGFIDASGKIITPCNYDGFSAFTDAGVSRVEQKVDGKTKYGYVDDKGKQILAAEHDNLQSFRNGWGLMKKDGNYHFIDRNGNQADPPRKYDELVEFRSGYAVGTVKATDTNTYYYINPQLKEEFSVRAKQAWQFWDDVAVINRTGVYELMNKKGQIIKKLDGVTQMKFSTNGMLAVQENGKWGYVDNAGNSIVTAKYDSCDQFKYGYGRVRLNNKWGMVDKTGKEVIAPTYENVLAGENDVFIYFDKAWGILDKTGKVVVPATFYFLTQFEKNRALARLGKTYTILKSPLSK